MEKLTPVNPAHGTMSEHTDTILLDQFVATFGKFDDLWACVELDPIAWQLAVGDADECGYKQWRPLKASTNRQALDALYAHLPVRLPALYEQLILSYRWAEVDLGDYRLLANPPGQDLSGLLAERQKAQILWQVLTANGYLQFGKGADLNYDPVCFDLRQRLKHGDYRIVQLDHEEILCYDRIKEVTELAPSFQQLVLTTIAKAS